MRLVNEEGQLVVMSLEEAMAVASSKSLDLVEVSPDQDPPIVKTIDYSRVVFEQRKKLKESKKKQKIVHLKEIKMRPRIDGHDYEHKLSHAKAFLEEGDKVKFTITFRGREIVHSELGYDVMNNIMKDMEGIAQIEKMPSSEGRNITMIMTSLPSGKGKKKI